MSVLRGNAQIRVGFSTFSVMEPTSIDTGQKSRTGRPGSLDNPEVYAEHVPGHVIPILEREFDDFDTEAKRFLDQEIAEDEFIGFWTHHSLYRQRQAERQMVRVKRPMGGINPDQIDAFAT